jgi:hypothetical protein
MIERAVDQMNKSDEMTRENRRKIADLIVMLSGGDLSIEESGIHFALRTVNPPRRNTVTVSNRANRVSFYIQSADLLKKVKDKKIKHEPTKLVAPRDRDRYRFGELGLNDIQVHEALFREIVQESVRVIMSRRSMKY